MGMWEIHIQSMYILPYLAASGHNLYTKSIHIYLQQMSKLRNHLQKFSDILAKDSMLFVDLIVIGLDFLLIL